MAKKKPGVKPRTKLTSKLIDDLCQRIVEGYFLVSACESLSLPRATFYRWLEEGENEDSEPLKHELYTRVMQARARQRGWLETRVYQENPLAFLKAAYRSHGDPLDPGWTEQSKLDLDAQIESGPIELVWPTRGLAIQENDDENE